MSILLFGKTVCPICNQIITSEAECYSFPAFVVNTLDPLYFFSDCSFHLACLLNHPFGERSIAVSKLFIQKILPSNRICHIGGNLIIKQENHIFIDLLTSNSKNDLYQYNFTHIDRNNLSQWRERENVIDQLAALQGKGNWQEFNGENVYLESLIKKLANPSTSKSL